MSFLTATVGQRFGPSFEEGRRADQAECSATAIIGAAGRSEETLARSDLPVGADKKVARHLLGRHRRPSSKEGPTRVVLDRRPN